MAQTLTIVKNGEDISGKGIRASEGILKTELPDLTMELLSNVIILGQGLPGRLTLNTPSGRKEVLEKLFKADFMIDDIKSRINDRLTNLKNTQRQLEDSILTINTKLTIAKDNISAYTNTLQAMQDEQNYNILIAKLNGEISKLTQELNYVKEQNEQITVQNQSTNDLILALTQGKVTISNSDYLLKEIEEIKEKGTNLKAKIIALDKDICEKDSITDVCPTCGQKLVGVEKPDTTKDKERSMKMKEEIEELKNQLLSLQEKRTNKINSELQKQDEQINRLQSQLQKVTDTSEMERILSSKQHQVDALNNELSLYDSKKEDLRKNIMANETVVKELEAELTTLSNDKLKIDSRLDIDNKINSIIKRDFRGYLLSNIIVLLNTYFKEYGKEVFNHTNLEIYQKGNNLEVTLNDKEYTLLSGGERQKIDVCLQLALRKVLNKYMGISCNIFCLDEIFDNLDEVGTDKILNVLSNKLDVPSIYIISHHADSLQIPFDSRIIVRKTKKGSTASQC